MNNNTSAELFPVFAAIPLTKTLFDLVVTEDDVLEVARLVLRQARNAGTKTYILYNVPIVDCHVQLPCDVFEIKGVFLTSGQAPNINAVPMSMLYTTGVEFADGSGTQTDIDTVALLEQELSMAAELELRNINKHQTIDYNFHGEELSFRQRSGSVNVIFTRKPKNCDGIEEVPEAVIEAIAYYMNFVDAQKRFLRGMIPMTIMEFAVKQKDAKVAQARMGGRISDNARKKILDVMHSYDRHQYGRPGRR